MSFAEQMPAASTSILSASVVSAIAYGLVVCQRPGVFRTASKTAATALLALLVVACGGSAALASALLLGALGDAFLAWSESDAAFLGGLGSFLCAHVLYTQLFMSHGGGFPRLQQDSWRMALAAPMLLAGPGFNYLLFSRTGPTLRWPVLAYSAIILGMFLSALTNDNARLVSGAMLFTLSDMILATEKFLVSRASSSRPWMQYTVWALYYSGQLLIALGHVGA